MSTTTSTPVAATPAKPEAAAQKGSRWLTLGAIAGPILFDLAATVLGLLRPGYSLVSRPVSALAVGLDGLPMRAVFLLYGLLVTAGVVGVFRGLRGEGTALVRRACTVLLVLSPLGVLWAGIFTMAPSTLSLHNMGVQFAFALPIIVFPIAGLLLRRIPSCGRFGTWMILGGPLTLALLMGLMQSVPVSEMATGGGRFGLWQRALAIEVQAWYVALAWLAISRTSRAQAKAYKGPAMEGFIATWYAKNTKGDARGYRNCAASVAERAPTGASVLELAAGPGYLAIELAKIGRHRVFGLDISRSFVSIATDNARAEGVSIEFKQGNASQMPYADASFDFVVCRAAFKNFADPTGALNEIYRVLKPGGKASIFDLRRESSREEIKSLVDSMNLSPLNALWTALTFRFFLLKNAYDRAAITQLAAESRFGRSEVLLSGVEFDLRLAKS